MTEKQNTPIQGFATVSLSLHTICGSRLGSLAEWQEDVQGNRGFMYLRTESGSATDQGLTQGQQVLP